MKTIYLFAFCNLFCCFGANAQEDFDVPFLHRAFFDLGYDQVQFNSFDIDSTGNETKGMPCCIVYTPYANYKGKRNVYVSLVDTADVNEAFYKRSYTNLKDTVVRERNHVHAVDSLHRLIYNVDTFCQPDAGCSFDSTHYYYGAYGWLDSTRSYNLNKYISDSQKPDGPRLTCYMYDTLGLLKEMSTVGKTTYYQKVIYSTRNRFSYNAECLPVLCIHENQHAQGNWHPYYKNVLTYSKSKLKKKRFFHMNPFLEE